MKLTIKVKNHHIDTSFIDYTDLTVIDNSTVELEIEKELSANEELKLSSDYNVISFSYEVTEMDNEVKNDNNIKAKFYNNDIDDYEIVDTDNLINDSGADWTEEMLINYINDVCPDASDIEII